MVDYAHGQGLLQGKVLDGACRAAEHQQLALLSEELKELDDYAHGQGVLQGKVLGLAVRRLNTNSIKEHTIEIRI